MGTSPSPRLVTPDSIRTDDTAGVMPGTAQAGALTCLPGRDYDFTAPVAQEREKHPKQAPPQGLPGFPAGPPWVIPTI